MYKDDVDSLYLVDWIYNSLRPANDNVPASVANFKNIPLYETTTAPYSLVHTGGNFITDGFGTAFSSNLVLDEETLLVSDYPTGVVDGLQIEANLNYVLSNFNSVYEKPYEVIRIPAPSSTSGAHPDNGGYYRTYSNQVFVNKKVILPIV